LLIVNILKDILAFYIHKVAALNPLERM